MLLGRRASQLISELQTSTLNKKMFFTLELFFKIVQAAVGSSESELKTNKT